MANLSFVDAINDFRRKSVLAGRPAEKAAMDKSLRENAIRRLTTTRDRVAPMTPAIAEVVQGGGDMMEPPIGPAPGTEGVVPGIGGVEAGVIGKGTAEAIEGTLASMLGFEKGEHGYQPTPTMPLSVLSFLQPNIMQKGFQISKSLLQNAQSGELGDPGTISSGMGKGQPASIGLPAYGGSTQATPPDVEGGPMAGKGSGEDAGLGLSGLGGIKVLCGELYRQGRMYHYLYEADCRYALTIPREVIVGYHFWAIPLAKLMKRSTILSMALAPIIHAWAEEMAYRVGVLEKGNWLGKVLSFIGEPVCWVIGHFCGHNVLKEFQSWQ